MTINYTKIYMAITACLIIVILAVSSMGMTWKSKDIDKFWQTPSDVTFKTAINDFFNKDVKQNDKVKLDYYKFYCNKDFTDCLSVIVCFNKIAVNFYLVHCIRENYNYMVYIKQIQDNTFFTNATSYDTLKTDVYKMAINLAKMYNTYLNYKDLTTEQFSYLKTQAVWNRSFFDNIFLNDDKYPEYKLGRAELIKTEDKVTNKFIDKAEESAIKK